MSTLNGDLSLVGLRRILNWAETTEKTGTLKISARDCDKSFYLQDGALVFVTSNRPGERIGEFLAATTSLPLSEIKNLIETSRQQGVPFTGHLVAEGKITAADLEETISQLATLALVDALSWGSGAYQFSEAIPEMIADGPIRVPVAKALARAELMTRAAQASRSDSKDELLRKIAKTLARSDFELPPMPDMLVRIHKIMRDDDGNAHEIMKIIMADQILTTKILRIVNSAYYSLPNRVSSLQHAIVFVGFKAIVNIVTAHALNSLSCKNRAVIREILSHCLKCGFIAKALASRAGMDEEEMFVCGLLHDIGKTVLLNVLEDFSLPDEAKLSLLQEYHQQAGATLAARWNLSPVIQNVIRHHHSPERASYEKQAVELIFLTNQLVNTPEDLEESQARCSLLPIERLNIEGFLAGNEELDQAIAAFL